MHFSALAPLVPLLAAIPAQAYFVLTQPILEVTRLDPIVSPGNVASHVHTIAGGSNFDKAMSYASSRASKCTTAPVSVDLSSYWVPQLYYYNPADKSYTAIPAGALNAYYLPRGGKNDTVRAFPDGLRMISGDPGRRTFDPKSAADLAISYVCLDFSGADHRGDPAWDQRNSFFEHNCPNGMRAQVNFPSCWDGVNLDSPDHKSHMAFASGGPNGGGDCPASHPVHLVSLFYEFVFDVQKFPFNNGSDPTWVFANGDATGYGYHGDFINGWPELVNGTNILQEAIDGCNDNDGVGGNLKDCPPFVPYLDNAASQACKPENPMINEDVGFGHSIARLPGNNPLWTGTGPKPSWPGYTEGSPSYTNFQSEIPSGYTYSGCIAEGKTGRALTGARLANSQMTRGACVSWCQGQGFPLAGIEYGSECYCGFMLANGATNATLLPSEKCGMSCAANTYETCGGSSTLDLFNNPSLYPVSALPAGWTANGCQTEATGKRALSGYSFASGSMTPQLCMSTCQQKGFTYAGAEYASECYCGNAFNNGSLPVADSQCSMSCSGDKTTNCGAGNRLTTWKLTGAAAKSRRDGPSRLEA